MNCLTCADFLSIVPAEAPDKLLISAEFDVTFVGENRSPPTSLIDIVEVDENRTLEDRCMSFPNFTNLGTVFRIALIRLLLIVVSLTLRRNGAWDNLWAMSSAIISDRVLF